MGESKALIKLNGNTTINKVMEISWVGFEYGDVIRLYHAEGYAVNRYNPTGSVENKRPSDNYEYVITEAGLSQK